MYAAANAAAAAVNSSNTNTSNQSIVTTSPSNSSISSANSSFNSENKNSQIKRNKKSKKKLNNSISDSDSNSSENKLHNNEDSQDNNKTVQQNNIFREDNKNLNKCKDSTSSPLISPSSNNRIIKTDERFLHNSSSLYSQYQQASHYLNHQYLTSSSLLAAAVAAGVPLSQLSIPSGNSNNNTNSAFSPTSHQTILSVNSIPTSSSVSIPFY